ncbi:phosphoglycerate mutase family protein [uncultured Pseudoteredinibacter sp.]|uniref:histidine phosphatase family protein n=1 Tax=uncultured Pseudoteredinibacter sp. TaxID=1641701 RepID=UPI003430FD1B
MREKQLPAPIFFLRHGQTNWNLERKLQGLNDVSLNKAGLQQAKSMVPLVESLEINSCICSPMLRARQTLEQLQLNCSVRFDPAWQEISIARQSSHSLRLTTAALNSLKANTLIISHGSVFDALCHSLAIPKKTLNNCSLVEISTCRAIQIHHSGYPLMDC